MSTLRWKWPVDGAVARTGGTATATATPEQQPIHTEARRTRRWGPCAGRVAAWVRLKLLALRTTAQDAPEGFNVRNTNNNSRSHGTHGQRQPHGSTRSTPSTSGIRVTANQRSVSVVSRRRAFREIPSQFPVYSVATAVLVGNRRPPERRAMHPERRFSKKVRPGSWWTHPSSRLELLRVLRGSA